jgi:predicted negative regulator of RcsB-dependent stress response
LTRRHILFRTIFSAALLISPLALLPTLTAQNQAGAQNPLTPSAKLPTPVPTRVASSSEGQFGINETLFATLAAVNAAGYDAGVTSSLNDRYQVRRQLREELAKRNIACLPELKAFYTEHRKGSSTLELSQYISFALLAGPAPTFELPSAPLPPDVEPLREFSPLLVRFYKEANVKELWARSQPAYTKAISEYQDAVISTLFEANGYIRNASGYLGRRFEIILDLLGEPNQIQVRSYRDDYFVVITPTGAPVIDEIRDAYLAYILDPLTFKYSTVIKEKSALKKYADDAPALDLAYKDDFSLLVTKCLIKAIDSRMMHDSPENKQAFVNEAMREGYILTAAFADLLAGYEKQQEALRIYYPDLVAAIDVRKEQKRLKNVEFVQTIPSRLVAAPSTLELPPAEATLQSAEGLYEQEQYDAAAKLFKNVFEQTTEKSMQGRAYYGLARIAVHEKKPDEAVEMFQRTADANPNPAITAWAHVYLGRLAMAANDPETATSQFKLALAINGASPLALDAAQKGLDLTAREKKQ